MSKKKTTKQNQLLSPEKYIRQKSRNLPIYGCWINENWEKTRLASIFIARKHVNDNLTACFYLVDLGCLGVRDTFHIFNTSINEFMHKVNDTELEIITISYELAHNIIHSAVEYAEDLGFRSCRDFTETTSFFLEEDNDDIPLMIIECGGEDGKPIYINSFDESSAGKNQIMNQLEKTVGEGNYNYFFSVDKDDDDDDDDAKDDEYEDDEYDDKYSDEEMRLLTDELKLLDEDEQKKQFCELMDKMDKKKLNEEGAKRMLVLSDILSSKMVSPKELLKQTVIFDKDLNHPVVGDYEYPNSLSAGLQGEDTDIDFAIDMFLDATEAIEDNHKAKKALKKFNKEVGDSPQGAYLELLYLERKGKKKFVKKLEEYYNKYPDYFLIKLRWCMYLAVVNRSDLMTVNPLFDKIQNLLSDEKQDITEYEFIQFLFDYITIRLAKDEPDQLAILVAMEEYVKDPDFPLYEDLFDDYYENMSIAKLIILHKQLSYV
ncbi:MAG: hypothetical protein LBT27_01280 [Prevotellaceae bacterium]|jgi:hypothetical protein|nr:hypothetical protein [Prevotellaceae bacterium]